MQIISISNHEFRKIKQYFPDSGIKNMECSLYLLKDKYKWISKPKLYKKFNNTKGEYFSNKLYVISTLIDKKEEINMKEVVLPTELVSLDGEINGFAMPFIQNNVCASSIMLSESSHDVKIECLKQIGEILDKIERKGIFYPTDVHEGNFIFDNDDKMMKMVDMDSVSINGSKSFDSKYLTFNPNLWDYPHKYPMNDNDRHIANINTMYLSYIYMVLNYISGCCYMSELSVNDFYQYMKRLRSLGLDSELVDIFELIYTRGDNVSPLKCLDKIPEDIKRFSYRR